MIVEFFGLPGAGKSTVANALLSWADREGVEMHQFDRTRSNKRLEYIPRTPYELALFWEASALALNVSPRSLTRIRRARAVATAYRRAEAVISEGSGVMLLDQWVLLDVWSIVAFGYLRSTHRIKDVVERLCERHPRLVVHLDADVETVVERLRGRTGGRSRFERVDLSNAARWLRASVPVSSAIIEGVVRTQLPVLTLNGSDSPEKNAAVIGQVLLRSKLQE